MSVKVISIKGKERFYLSVIFHENFIFLLVFTFDSFEDVPKSDKNSIFFQHGFDFVESRLNWEEMQSLTHRD